MAISFNLDTGVWSNFISCTQTLVSLGVQQYTAVSFLHTSVQRDENSIRLCIAVDGTVWKKVQRKAEYYASEAVTNKKQGVAHAESL